LGIARGATHYLLVSSRGANRESRIFYYRVKGEVEHDILALSYRATTIARPSFLMGDRTELRIGERVVAKLRWPMPPSVAPFEARDVARALVGLAREDAPGARIVESDELRRYRAAALPRNASTLHGPGPAAER